jgi:tripeptide aminopeptidase
MADVPRRPGKHAGLTQFLVERIGDRPAGRLEENAPLLEALQAVDRHLGIRTELRVASTDANIPLSLGVPALSIGAGGDGGGIHTRSEWYDSSGRELALKRILLLLLLALEQMPQNTPAGHSQM